MSLHVDAYDYEQRGRHQVTVRKGRIEYTDGRIDVRPYGIHGRNPQWLLDLTDRPIGRRAGATADIYADRDPYEFLTHLPHWYTQEFARQHGTDICSPVHSDKDCPFVKAASSTVAGHFDFSSLPQPT